MSSKLGRFVGRFSGGATGELFAQRDFPSSSVLVLLEEIPTALAYIKGMKARMENL